MVAQIELVAGVKFAHASSFMTSFVARPARAACANAALRHTKTTVAATFVVVTKKMFAYACVFSAYLQCRSKKTMVETRTVRKTLYNRAYLK